jgi:hypothetical protein
MGLISLKITKSKLTETYGYKLQINFETVCFCTLAPASPACGVIVHFCSIRITESLLFVIVDTALS